ncbi:hypothetical protein [Anaeromyxobacter paludicola]|uniref:Uncharacterized protein n=1 Tax=Anaeromyxobacter paludicola TaxID=2918171 RepID=A0ABM7X7Y0_9BACT|nr:hypothetical protein [Anaeromyxobacter paludicola]BDG07946.1 hypothetical protein AMPC_10590 [Anaeromyxobacter paludicola]
MRKKKLLGNLKVGRADVSPSAPSHVRGVREGNQPGAIDRMSGLHPHPTDARFATGTAERSTGINARARNPIDPASPNLSPS